MPPAKKRLVGTVYPAIDFEAVVHTGAMHWKFVS